MGEVLLPDAAAVGDEVFPDQDEPAEVELETFPTDGALNPLGAEIVGLVDEVELAFDFFLSTDAETMLGFLWLEKTPPAFAELFELCTSASG